MRKLLLLGLLAASPAFADGKVVARKAAAEPAADEIGWRYAAVLEPVDLVNGAFPAFELQRALRTDLNHPNSLALAYWGNRSSSFTSYGLEGTTFSSSAATTRGTSKKMDILTARYMLYAMRSFHLNFGAGARQTSTQEYGVFATGERVSASKREADLGIEFGLGNRWVLFNKHLVLGGNWLEIYYPMATLSRKDAKAPAGYTTSQAAADVHRPGVRLSALDIGWAW